MYQLSTLLLALSVAGSVTAAPTHINKRIAQDISASTKKWEDACDAAGGAAQCNTIAVNSFSTLLAAAGACDQQDAADNMMDLSKTLNSADMITAAQIFGQQARNSPDSLSVPYCQKAPRNAELTGVFQCQFQGVDPTKFTGGLAAGSPGTIPFGQTQALNPPGSCPANPTGPIPNGDQLSDLVTSSGLAGTGAGNGNSQNTSSASPAAASPSASASVAPAAPAAASAIASATPASSSATSSASVAPAVASAIPASSSAAAAAPSGQASATTGFAHQNGQDAQALNAQFASLTGNSPCNDGEQACVNGDFAQCVNGKFATTPCSSGLQCFALPLVNSPGTSVTCTTQADANTRIATALGN